jgi:hypothetical protein
MLSKDVERRGNHEDAFRHMPGAVVLNVWYAYPLGVRRESLGGTP